jgi:hypothetical protein
MASNRVGKNLKPYLEKAKDSALLAIEVYNKPAIKFRSAGYIALMVIAWSALMHAIFLRRGILPYWKKNGRFEKIDGDYRHWELAECAKQLWGSDTQNPIRKNLEFFVPLRNKIEHRHVPELDAAIFGECQALLLNFDEALGQYFGAKHQIRESLSFSLQLFPSGDSFAQAVKANKGLADIKRFIDNYRGMMAADVVGSSQFAFKAFLIQVANHDSGDALPIQFVRHDKLTAEQQEEFEKFAVMVKWKAASVINSGLLKPAAVVSAVQRALGNPKVSRVGRSIDKFNQTTHERCWKRYGVRPANGAKKPEATKREYCNYDEPHKDYLYTAAWIDFLVTKMGDDDEYAALYKRSAGNESAAESDG